MTARTILITGCSSGIGRDAALALHRRGWRVLATCRKAGDCDALHAEGLKSFPLDLADPGSVAAAPERVRETTGGTLDALFNNGAFALPGALEDLPRDGMRAIFETNLFGTHDLTRQLLPLIGSGGRIVSCSSVLGYVGLPWRGAYVATKHALEGWSDVLRLELRERGIHVVLLEPGPIATRIRVNALPHFERWIDWESSPRAEQYRRELLPRLYGPPKRDRFELPPAAVTAALIRALEAPRPRARYRVTLPAHGAAVLRRVLPTRMLDRVLGKR